MGKGAGCATSKTVEDEGNQASAPQRVTEQPVAANNTAQPTTAIPAPEAYQPYKKMSAPKKIYVIYYSTYGHIHTLVQEAVKGINAVGGVEAVVYQVDLVATASSHTLVAHPTNALCVFSFAHHFATCCNWTSYLLASGSSRLLMSSG